MIKVCHMTSAHPPEDIRIFRKECVSLAQNDYEVFLVEQGESYEKDGVKIVGIGSNTHGRIKRALVAAKEVYKKAAEVDADIYQFHDPELLLYGLKLKRKGKKVIFDSHEYYREQIKTKQYLPKLVAFITSKLYAFIEDYVLARIDGIIFPCNRDGVHPFQGKCRNVAIVNNTPMLQELYEQYDPKIEKNDESVCYIGSLTQPRGVTNAIMAAFKSGARLYLGGAFDSEDYKNEIQSMPEYKSVVYLGVLDRDQVLEILQACKVGMANLLSVGQYNTFDNLPTKVYEYMTLSIPVILSKSRYNDEVMNQYKFGITVDPEDIDEMARAIRFLLDNPDEAEIMGKNGRDAVKNCFNWERDFANMLELYEAVIDSNHA